jgi:hypothetical protein
MHIIEITYLALSVASVIAMVTQVKRLLITKQSDELSLATWVMWATYQASALVYSISLHAVAWLATNIAWVSFYVIMLALIIKYRKKAATVTVQASNESSALQPNSSK